MTNGATRSHIAVSVDVPLGRIYGVDFSGASDAGRKIWIAGGSAKGGLLQIHGCSRAEDLPGSGRERDRCLAALRGFIRSQEGSAFGFDFPFGLPAALLNDHSWEGFAAAFGRRYLSSRQFRRGCIQAAGGRELKRLTDREARTPFSPYNLRVHCQTYYGIRDLLVPLIEEDSARILPMQEPHGRKPWVVEVCPASLLKRQGIYVPYKGRTEGHRMARQRILRHFHEAGMLDPLERKLRRTALDDPEGDALDAVLAALVTLEAASELTLQPPTRHRDYLIEGCVYPTRNWERGSHPELSEASLREVSVERERLVQPEATHQDEAGAA